MRWLLLDEIEFIKKGKEAKTLSRIPDAPYSAETLLIEMMAQTGGLLVGAESDYQKNVVFAKIEFASFEPLPPVKTPIEIIAKADSLGEDGGWFAARILQSGKEIASAKIFLIAVAGLSSEQTSSVTFHDAFMNHFEVRKKILIDK